MKLKAGGKMVLIAAVVGVIGYGLNLGITHGYFNGGHGTATQTIEAINVPTTGGQADMAGTSNIAIEPTKDSYNAKLLTIPWNATMGLHFANGGATTEAGSLMAKHGVKLTIERQDDYSQMIAEQVKFAAAVAKGDANPSDGAAFVVIMGDGYPAYIAGAQEALSKLGQQLQVVGALGYSRGEDKCMLPPDVKADPQKARGSLIGAVLRDGDWNICVKWASDNGIPVNPNEKTYDPDAMNFVAVDAFTKADNNYIAGYCETRPVVSKGKNTGETRKVCQNGTATWTPGDVKVATKKGGVVAVASTKEYMWQMPAIVIGNKQWMEQHRSYVENFLAAAFEGGELVRSSDAALTKGAEVSAKVYKEESAEYWKKYFKGITSTDATGHEIQLGGSSTNGLGDNAYLFGLNGADNLYKRVYTVFGGITSKLYPHELPKLVNYDDVVNTSYLQSLLGKAKSTVQADKPTFTPGAQVTGTFAKRSYSIEFETGKASFTPAATETLSNLLDQLSISGLTVQVNGHTDNVGSSTANLTLSKQRAEAVRAWLSANAPSSFPADRIRARGYGDAQPVADNKTVEGRSKNRRVDVLLVNTQQ
jgi:outer membrane protein OmpA-like peptidoglycan-associated protein